MWLSVVLLSSAWAQDPSEAAPTPDAETSRYAVSFRYKRGWVPNGILDTMYFDSDDPGALPYDRPKVQGYVMGLEFGLQPLPDTFLFYAEYFHIGLDPGYWDDTETPPNHLDGDWIDPDGLGMFALGANYAYEVALSEQARDVWLSLHFGGGLGLGFTTGKLTQWHPGAELAPNLAPVIAEPDCEPTEIAPNRQRCRPDDEWRPPPVLPIIDVTLGLRLHIADHAHLRFDAGLHDMLYVGFAGGGEW
ncbi:MAG: hypothetical protein ACI9K2_000444 [Myxococcota bacterium]|jgi:hypothetical protein